MTNSTSAEKLTRLTSQIVAAYVQHNFSSHAELPPLIRNVHAALAQLGNADQVTVEPDEKPHPAVPVKKSITPDFLICLEDGKPFKSLKRHLMAKYDMTPDEYRTKWGLPANYPMSAPNYSRHRSELAMANAIGQRKKVEKWTS